MTGEDRQEGAAPPAADGDARRRLLGLLGLARRAGRLQVGYVAVQTMVQRGERPLVIIAADTGPGQRRRIQRWTEVRGLLDCGLDAEALGGALGRGRVAVVGLSGADFIKGIQKLGL